MPVRELEVQRREWVPKQVRRAGPCLEINASTPQWGVVDAGLVAGGEGLGIGADGADAVGAGGAGTPDFRL